MEYKLVGNRVKRARNDKDMTQEKFAEELGVSVSFVSQVEAGNKKFNLARISEVSRILERPVSYFIDGYSDDNNSDIDEIMDIVREMSPKQLKLTLDVVRAIDSAE